MGIVDQDWELITIAVLCIKSLGGGFQERLDWSGLEVVIDALDRSQ